jgi:flagellar basal-body rod modification protein FlgD
MNLAEINASLGTTKSAAGEASTNLASNFDDFLTLLTTQLTNQDPLDPADTSEFTNQLVNFTNVEQSIATNQNLEALIQLQQLSQQNNQASTLIGYLGKTVGSNINIGDLNNGSASWNIDFGSNAAKVTYDIYNSAGTKVYSEEGDGATAGEQVFSWDGKTSSGTDSENGAYYLVVTAESDGGSTVNVGYDFEGVATSVETVNGTPVLMIGNVYLGIGDINSIHLAPESDPSA